MNRRSKLTIATRKSPLALWQAEYVAKQISVFLPTLSIEVKGFSTSGDEKLDTSLNKIGGKGLFTKELEQALLDGTADLAVHSMKDLPVDTIPELSITAVCRRGDPSDVFVSDKYKHWQALPSGAKVGTSSLRRKMQLIQLRPDLDIVSLRGNIQTRLNKVHSGDLDAIILAAAGLMRLGLEEEIQYRFTLEEMLPAIGQGVIGIQIRQADLELAHSLMPINCQQTWLCLLAERALSQQLNASCEMPLAGFARIVEDRLELSAKLGASDNATMIEGHVEVPMLQAATAGEKVAKQLFALGAADLIAAHRQWMD